MSSVKKALLSLAAVGLVIATALGVRIYRRPRETMMSLLRLGMLLMGAREETCDIAGTPIHYYCAGRRGEPLVCIHGLGGSAENWRKLFPLLSQEYLVYALDLPGFGRTPLASEGVDIEAHVLYLERFLDALGYPQVTLVGNSLGGWIATRFAVEHPERVKQLYLLNSAGLRREGIQSPYTPNRQAVRLAAKRIWGCDFPLPNFVLDAIVRNSLRPAYAGFIQNYQHQKFLDSLLTHVQVPTTIIWGTQDRLLPDTCAQDLHTGIAGSQLVLLPGAGHSPHSSASTEVAQIILHHLRQEVIDLSVEIKQREGGA